MNMALIVDIKITVSGPGGVSVKQVEQLIIQRLEPLNNPESPDDEVHTYRVQHALGPVEGTTFQHRYGDRALVCIQKAIEATKIQEN